MVMITRIKVSKAQSDTLPWDLLLEADPEKSQIEQYIYDSQLFLYTHKEEVCGILVLKKMEKYWEIMNLSVVSTVQNQGIGGQLIEATADFIKQDNKCKRLVVRTGDVSYPARALYAKMGFEEIGRVPNYFLDHYPELIYENGELLQDQLVYAREANF